MGKEEYTDKMSQYETEARLEDLSSVSGRQGKSESYFELSSPSPTSVDGEKRRATAWYLLMLLGLGIY